MQGKKLKTAKARRRNRTVMSEIITSFVFLILFTSIAMGTHYFVSLGQYVDNQVTAYQSEIIRQVGEKLDYYLESVYISERQLLGTVVQQDLFQKSRKLMDSSTPGEHVRNVEDELKNVRRTSPCISNIYLIGTTEEFYTSSNFFVKERLTEKEWYQGFMRSDANGAIVPAHHADYQVVYGTGPRVVSFMKKITNPKDARTMIGVIQIDMDYARIRSVAESIRIDDENALFILDENGTLLYSPQEADVGKSIGQVQVGGKGLDALMQDDREYSLSEYRTALSSWRVVGVVSKGSVNAKFNTALWLSILIAISTLILSLGSAYLLAKRITRPIENLVSVMGRAGRGHFDVRAKDSVNRDMQALSSGFNTMLDQINRLMENLVRKEHETANARFLALQAQINPHFLYNTLETMRSIAIRHNVNGIADIAKSMAAIFRYSISRSRDEVTLAEELTHARHYVGIQQSRYKERLAVSFEVDEKVLEDRVIKLIIQPLVENAIYHGIERKTGEGHVRILCRATEYGVYISIRDDGIGMPEALLAELKEKMNRDYDHNATEGIGILNVNARLKLYYGGTSALHIHSTEDQGTEVWFEIPVRRDAKELKNV
ncbi:MAG: sensor histidine kinase [Candidatus Limiplasma sp.]|nr:sensor histidine kinase [Candidatus Limiplasma sp.]